ncbi:MAG: hypothetical protein BRC47_15545 [Cyanobacteria bacterium QS_7_48_42]|nr:MAG: hypothetical protein BRC47_15545 [Cyanobacteria bacterium QS_7_48_42]
MQWWGPLVAGIFIATATQQILNTLGTGFWLAFGIGGRAGLSTVDLGVEIGTIISFWIALFTGSWVMARTCSSVNKKTALLNGAILWATTLALGIFGSAAAIFSNLQNQAANADPSQVRQLASQAAKVAWSFVIGSAIGLVIAMMGASVGARKPGTRA